VHFKAEPFCRKEEELFLITKRSNFLERYLLTKIVIDPRTPAFIGLLITHMGNNWGSFIIGTEMPTYLNNIQHVSLKQVSYKIILYVNIIL